MPKPTLFTVASDGQERLLFLVQQRATGDLTIVMKHSLLHVTPEWSAPTVEERFSVHCSPCSASINAVKYTKVLKDRPSDITRNHTEAMKLHNRFCGVLMRRAGNLSDARYLFAPTKGEVISLGSYDPRYFQPTVFVLVSLRDREFIADPLLTDVNVRQLPLGPFRITVMWQFLMMSGLDSSQSLIPKTFKQEDIDAAEPVYRNSMADMALGLDERGAYEAFKALKTALAHAFLNMAWDRSTPADRKRHADLFHVLREIDIYLPNGTAFGREHKELLQSLPVLVALRRHGTKKA